MNRAQSVLTTCGIVFLALGLSAFGGCSPGAKTSGIAQAPAGMHEIMGLYQKTTDDHRRAVRGPVRDYRSRAMRALSDKAGLLAAETAEWESEARLTSADAADQDEIRAAISTYRNSLRNLSDAAGKSRRSDLRECYAASLASYRRLIAVTGAANY